MRSFFSSMVCYVFILAGVYAQDAVIPVTGFELIDAETDRPIRKLQDNETVDLSEHPAVSIRALVSAPVSRVVFGFDNQERYHVESSAPYAIGGDSDGDYSPWNPPSGKHTITATAFADRSGRSGTGVALSITLNFKHAQVTENNQNKTRGDKTETPDLPSQKEYLQSLLNMAGNAEAGPAPNVSGEKRLWHKITLTFDGPGTDEQNTVNPFADYRLDVIFTNGDQEFVAPGYYAADGDAAESGADSGPKWRVHFMPTATGTWHYTAFFRSGEKIAQVLLPDQKPVWQSRGTLDIADTDKNGPDFRARGLLQYVGKHHLRFAGSGEYFLKGGADSPENFLGYVDFDQTPKGEHRYEPHLKDWRPGDPTWRDGKGKGMIGALNYLASKGMNSVYFLTMNVNGDGKDVWPWTSEMERVRYDCSKLDQWEVVFSHMDRLGLMLHVITQETENDQLLDAGNLGPQRILYYRELIARFGHHPALVWNLGEENSNTDAQRMTFAAFFDMMDPYDHPVVCHSRPGDRTNVYPELLGYPYFEGPSLQTNRAHRDAVKWREQSAEAGRPWFVCNDESGPAQEGVKPDSMDPNHDEPRIELLWGNLMGGGAGVEWYFGYRLPHNDLNCEDWRSRDRMWDQTRFALEFFQVYLPFWEMQPMDQLVKGRPANGPWCLGKPGEIYVVYIHRASQLPPLDLSGVEGTFSVHWFDPDKGGELRVGAVDKINGGEKANLGQAPDEGDWAVLIRKQ